MKALHAASFVCLLANPTCLFLGNRNNPPHFHLCGSGCVCNQRKLQTGGGHAGYRCSRAHCAQDELTKDQNILSRLNLSLVDTVNTNKTLDRIPHPDSLGHFNNFFFCLKIVHHPGRSHYMYFNFWQLDLFSLYKKNAKHNYKINSVFDDH